MRPELSLPVLLLPAKNPGEVTAVVCAVPRAPDRQLSAGTTCDDRVNEEKRSLVRASPAAGSLPASQSGRIDPNL